MKTMTYRGIRPDDLHGRMGLRNPERGFRTEMYFSRLPGEVAGTCSCHAKQLKLDGRSEKPVFQNIDIPGVPHLIRGNRLDGVEFSHGQWQDELDFLSYDGVTVMQSYCFLMAYGDGRDLPQEKLDDLELFLKKVRESGVKALLRFAYELSPSFSGPTAETTLKHLGQLAPVLLRNLDVIYVLQCGFVGMFGEWHNSYHHLQDDVAFQRDLLSAVLEMLPPERKTMLRYPNLKIRVFGPEALTESEAFTNEPRARIGHFNDGFLAGRSHGGTFGRKESILSYDDEQAYLEREGQFLPMDGELFWRDLSGMALPVDALNHFYKWHYDTFGMVHGNSLFEGDRYSIDVWKSVPVNPMYLHDHQMPISDGYFQDASGRHVWRSTYEYIRDHLGYRLELTSAELPEQVAAGQPLQVTVKLVNRGFSAPVNPRPVQVVLFNAHQRFEFEIPADVRRWYGHGTEQTLRLETTVPAEVTEGLYQVALWLPDGSPTLRYRADYAIRCANAVPFVAGMNVLGNTKAVVQ